SGQTRVLLYDYETHGLLKQISGVLTGTLALVRANPAGATAPSPPGASVNSTLSAPTFLWGADYYSNGNIYLVTAPTDRCTSFAFDTAYAQLPTQTSYWLSGGCFKFGYTETRVFDRGVESVTTSFSIANEMSSMEYDAFRRLTRLFRQDPQLPAHS